MDGKRATILIAEDDPEDRYLMQEGFKDAQLGHDVRFVQDGEELMDYLLGRGSYANDQDAPGPDLILLDFNMPRKNGLEAMQEIKGNPNLRGIPVVVMTTDADMDIIPTNGSGVIYYIPKPVNFDKLADVIRSIPD